MSFLRDLFSDSRERARPLHDALIEALGKVDGGDEPGALDVLAEAVRGRFQLALLELYMRDRGVLRRVGTATDVGVDRRSIRPGPLDGAVPAAALQNVGATGSLSGSGWVALPGGRVWWLAADAQALSRSVAEDAPAARAMAGAVMLAARGAMTPQNDRSQWIHDDVQRRVARAAADTRAAVELFLRMALTGFSGEGGAVVSIEEGTGERVTWASAGAVAADAAGVDAVRSSGRWVAEVVDAARFAPSARSVYAVAQPHRGGVLLVAIAAGAAGATAPGEVAYSRLEQAVAVIRSLVEGQEAARRASAHIQQLVDGLVTMVETIAEPSRGHHARVSSEAERIGRRLGVEPERFAALMRAVQVHDIGRIGVAADPTGNVVEFLHPTVGGSLLEALGEPQNVSDLVRVHHERWDGQGFPLGVAPAETDLAAWALVAAQDYADHGEEPADEASRRRWARDHGPGLLPPAVLEKLSQGWA